MRKITLAAILVLLAFTNFAQTTNDVLELLIKNKAITQEQTDSVRAEAAIKQQDIDANKKSFTFSTSRLIQFSGYTQIRYRFQQDSKSSDGFDIRRARLDIRGNVTPYFSYRLQTDFAVTPKLLDAYGEIKLNDLLNFTIGQAKIPFSMENLASSNKMESIDRSQVVEALVARSKDTIGNHNGRDIGVQLGGSFGKIEKRYLIDYKIGFFNGAGINTDDKNDYKDIVGRLVFHPIKGFDLGGSYYTGVSGKLAPGNQDRKRFGLEVNYEFKRFFIRGEYIEGKDAAVKRNGWYAQAGYFLIPAKFQLIAKYDTYDTNTAKPNDISTAYLIGGTYNFNNWSRIQAGYTIKREEGKELTNNYGVMQYQISF